MTERNRRGDSFWLQYGSQKERFFIEKIGNSCSLFCFIVIYLWQRNFVKICFFEQILLG